jgi:hypothetical protein
MLAVLPTDVTKIQIASHNVQQIAQSHGKGIRLQFDGNLLDSDDRHRSKYKRRIHVNHIEPSVIVHTVYH